MNVQMLEKMILQIPDEELQKRMTGLGMGKDDIKKIMECVSNSRLKYSSEKSEEKEK